MGSIPLLILENSYLCKLMLKLRWMMNECQPGKRRVPDPKNNKVLLRFLSITGNSLVCKESIDYPLQYGKLVSTMSRLV